MWIVDSFGDPLSARPLRDACARVSLMVIREDRSSEVESRSSLNKLTSIQWTSHHLETQRPGPETRTGERDGRGLRSVGLQFLVACAERSSG